MLRFVDEESPDTPIDSSLARLYEPLGNKGPQTFEQSDPFRQQWEQEQLRYQDAPNINIESDVDRSDPQIQLFQQILDQQPLDVFQKERLLDNSIKRNLS